MRSLISKLRLERLLKSSGGSSGGSGVKPGKLEIVETQEALAVAENLISDGIAYYSENGFSGSQNGNGVATSETLNAFGRPVMNLGAESVSGAIAAGAGMGLTGLRAAVFVSGDQFSEGLNQVQVLPTKHIPLVLHASFREASGVESSHDGFYTAKDMGFFQVMPGSIQEAVDLTLLARWLAERALIPGFVASDRHAVERVILPTVELVRQFLGDSGEEIESPSAAQFLLFGGRRSTAPRWYDLDRPVSFSSLQGSSDGISAAVGREVFFSKHIAALAEEGMAKLGKLTGRPLSFVSEYAVDDADQVVVTQGSAFQTARAAAELLRNEKGWKVGVLGATWLRPFPAAQIQSALGRKKRVVVLECTSSALVGEPPLLREIRSCLSTNGSQWVSATYGLNGQPLHLGEVSQLIADSRAKDARTKVWLGITSSKPKAGDFPKREGLLTAVNSDYPELTKATITAAEPLDYPGNETRSLQWVGPHTSSISETMERLAKTCSDVAGPEVHGYGWSPEPGVLSIRVSAGNSSAPIPEVGAYIDILLLGRQGLDLIYNPLADLRKGGSVVIESERTEEEIWALMPDFWRSEIRRLKLRLYKVEDGFEELNAAASALLSEAVELPFPELKWAEAADSERESNEVPALIRRVGEANTDYDNLPRFWGEVMQPKRGGISDNSPDPLVTLGAVPPYTAALARPRGTALPNIPKLDAEKCTGCGRCWPVCPDSAIGVSVIGLQEYLDSAAGLTVIDGKVAGAVRRAHRPIAVRVATMLSKQEARQITAEVLLDAYATVSEKMPIPDAERDEYSNVFQATVEIASQLNPVISTVFYDQPESAKKGTGKLLLLAINPDACQGCQLCITSCPETALTAVERAGERRASQEGWRVWEQMPDTAGETIAQASEKLDWGTLAARLLSRHCSQVQAVGSFGEPGSGERLAARLVTSFTESVTQRHMTELAAKSETLANSLNEEVKTLLAEGLSGAESGAIQAALEKLPRHRTNLSELSDRLSELGKSVSVDPVKTLRLIQIAQELNTDHWNITEGVHGLGRARFGVVILSNRIARWAGRFPNHPYLAPLIVDPSKDGAQLVFGLAKALTAKHLDKIRLQRKAQLWLDSPPDLPGQLYDIDHISWQDLSDEEKLACPPLLVFSDETALGRQGLAEFSSLLTSELPVKIVLLDSRNIHEQSVEPTLLAMSYQSAFVLSSSLAHPEQFASGLDQALAYAGPSLVHLHVPVPSEDGYSQAKTIERARLAVEARVHPLLTFDPSADGVYGLRLSLDGNPSLTSDWGELNPLEWALGEKRFARDFSPVPDDADAVSFEEYIELDPAERIGKTVELENPANGEKIEASARLAREAARRLLIWKTAQEIAGRTSPFVERIRADVEKEIEAKQQKKVAAMQKDYEGQIAQLKNESDGKVVDQLRQRLLTLAGFGPNSSESKEDANE